MKILRVSDRINWNHLEKQKRYGDEVFKTSIYERNGLKLTTHTIYKNGKKTASAKELCDYLGNIISAKVAIIVNGIKTKERRI